MSTITFSTGHKDALMVEITTDRLYMRTVNEEDLPESQKLYGDADVTAYFDDGQPKSAETVAKLIRDIGIDRFQKQDPYGLFSVFDKDTKEFIGHFDFLPEHEDKDNIEIGFIVHTKYQGKKYGNEIGRAINDYAVALLETKRTTFKKLTATAHPDNVPSWKVLENMGMKCVAEGWREEFQAVRKWYALEITQ